ncbi:MAG: hypothetical protein ACTHQ3_15440, partial [Motilibacteraceae bacterium]
DASALAAPTRPSPLIDPAVHERPHEVSVVHRGMFAVATCADCDWTGRARRAVSSARADADLHRNLGAGL